MAGRRLLGIRTLEETAKSFPHGARLVLTSDLFTYAKKCAGRGLEHSYRPDTITGDVH